jgi:hypothetical protein
MELEEILSILVGIGLSAACGLRVFVPLLGLSIASMNGYVHLDGGFQWIGSWPALLAFSTATVLEIAAYYIPWLDHALDTVATPAAVVAGVLVTASMITDMPPLMKWSLAIIAGGGSAGVVQTGTMFLRGLSTATTGGAGNFIVSTLELIGSILLSILAIVIPVVCVGLFAIFLVILIRVLNKSSAPKTAESAPNPADQSSV